MRNALCETLVGMASDPDFVFLTGDLGYLALEPLQAALGPRFINAGVAEQNMVSVAAGLARAGLRPWAYSIAPFLYARPFEQIRNDICLHDLPVTLAGNGGGYAYGVMGSTHHALEDYGALLTLPKMRAFVPAFAADLGPIVRQLFEATGPAYLRLGRDEKPPDFTLPEYAPWRRLLTGGGPVVVAVGPLAGTYWQPLAALPDRQRPAFWVATELPLTPETLPPAFLEDLCRAQSLIVLEEHVAPGGAGQMLAHCLLTRGQAPRRFQHRHACNEAPGRYGSQQFHRRERGLDPAAVLEMVTAGL